MKARASLAVVLALAAGGIIVGAAIAADDKETKAPGENVKCPVSGKGVNPDATVEFEECKVYFCCDKCPKAFENDKNHAKYGAKARHQMVQTEQLVQVACPFTGKPMNSEMAVEIEGVKVVFCCDKCKGKVENAKEEARLGMVFKDTKKGYKLAKDVEKEGEKK